jgi:hypothetical protein
MGPTPRPQINGSWIFEWFGWQLMIIVVRRMRGDMCKLWKDLAVHQWCFLHLILFSLSSRKWLSYKNNYIMYPTGAIFSLQLGFLFLLRFVFFPFSPLRNRIPHLFRGESVLLPFYLRVEGTVAWVYYLHSLYS